MKTLHIPGMHCQHCVARISKALGEAGIAFTIDLDSKTVSVEETKEAAAREALDDLGFEADR